MYTVLEKCDKYNKIIMIVCIQLPQILSKVWEEYVIQNEGSMKCIVFPVLSKTSDIHLG